MDINKVHTPERLDGENLQAYRYRQQLSKRLATHTPVFHESYRLGTYFKTGTVSPQKLGATKRRKANSDAVKASKDKRKVSA